MKNQASLRSQQYNALSTLTEHSVHVKDNDFYEGADKLEVLRIFKAVGYRFKVNPSEFGHHIFFNNDLDKREFEKYREYIGKFDIANAEGKLVHVRDDGLSLSIS